MAGAPQEPLSELLQLIRNSSFLMKNPQKRYDVIFPKIIDKPDYFIKIHGMTFLQFSTLKINLHTHFRERRQSLSFFLSVTLRFLKSYSDEVTSVVLEVIEADDIVNDVSKAINYCLAPLVFPELPQDYLLNIASDFESRWHFPNCFGALEARSILCQDPTKDVYERFFEYSFVVIVDSHYRFICKPVHISFIQGALYGLMDIPLFGELDKMAANSHPELHSDLPLVVVGGANFPLKNHIMRPFCGPLIEKEEKVYNYRHGRAKHVADTALGLLFQHWAIFQSVVEGNYTQISQILQCTVTLYNWLTNEYITEPSLPGQMVITDLMEERDENGYIKEGKLQVYSTSPGVTRVFTCDDRELPSARISRLLLRRYFLEEGQTTGQLMKAIM